MSATAGSGIQPVLYERGLLLLLRADDRTAVSPTATMQLPAGNWWKLDTVSMLLDATAAGFPVTYAISANYNAQILFRCVGLNQIPAGTFAGNILWGRQMTPQENVNEALLVGQLPDLWLPPSTVLSVSLQGIAGNLALSEVNAALHSTYNEPTS